MITTNIRKLNLPTYTYSYLLFNSILCHITSSAGRIGVRCRLLSTGELSLGGAFNDVNALDDGTDGHRPLLVNTCIYLFSLFTAISSYVVDFCSSLSLGNAWLLNTEFSHTYKYSTLKIIFYTGWAKKRGHSIFCRMSRKLPKIFTPFLHISRLVYTKYVHLHQV